MDIRCIALDLDRTTLDGHGKLSAETRRALLYAIQRGVHIVIASGRSISALPEDVVAVPGIEYAITSNGAAVYHLPTKTCLRRYTLTPQSALDVLDLTKGAPLAYEAFVDGKSYADADYVQDPVAYGSSPNSIPYVQKTRQPVADMPEFIRSHADALDSLDLVIDSAELKQDLWNTLRDQVPDLYITSSVRQLLELSHREAGKHSGVRFIANHLGISLQQCAAFGDGDNDADMLRCVGCGIAVENASPACIAAADMVTLHHAKNGVALGIYELLKI